MKFPADLKTFVSEQQWTAAKTYAKTWPHEYIVRHRVDQHLLVQVVKHIRTHGYVGRFYSKAIPYFDEEGMLYWTMGAPVEEPIVVNRCRKEQSYEYCLRHDILPDSKGSNAERSSAPEGTSDGLPCRR